MKSQCSSVAISMERYKASDCDCKGLCSALFADAFAAGCGVLAGSSHFLHSPLVYSGPCTLRNEQSASAEKVWAGSSACSCEGCNALLVHPAWQLNACSLFKHAGLRLKPLLDCRSLLRCHVQQRCHAILHCAYSQSLAEHNAKSCCSKVGSLYLTKP